MRNPNNNVQFLFNTLSPNQLKWLKNVCEIMTPNDFNTCGKDYDLKIKNDKYKYYKEYITYLWEFDNC